MAQSERHYECILFGATGYTGKFCAEHITSNLPTDFKWAVAGRSQGKLQNLVDEVKALNADRLQPGIEIAQLNKDDLVQLARKTKVLITTVGPYHKYGTVVVEACAETGTHYVDATGEVPWVSEIIQKYHEIAEKTGAIMIPQNGIESAPPDLMCWKLASEIRTKYGVGTGEITHTIYDINASASGGTLATAIGVFDHYGAVQLAKTSNPWSLCPVAPPKESHYKPFMESLTGIRTVSDLGTLTDSLQGPADVPIVCRTWGLYDGGKLYGPNFHVSAYMRTRNLLTGFGVHIGLIAAFAALSLFPVRWLLKQFIYQPGDGPSKEQAQNEYIEWRSIANADRAGSSGAERMYGRMRWEGSMYHFTGVTLAESALVLSREKTFAHELGGGILTPATLGDKYLEQLQNAGLRVEFKTLA